MKKCTELSKILIKIAVSAQFHEIIYVLFIFLYLPDFT